ncbi:MAG: hypothetical protein ACI9DG_002426 [Oleispira sp.]|jgi:hypothetical protein
MAKLQQEFHEKMHTAHYVINTERSYWHWIRDYMLHLKHKSRGFPSPALERMNKTGEFTVTSSVSEFHKANDGKPTVRPEFITKNIGSP